MTNVAAFDVDGTLTTRDCVVPFLASLVGGRPQLAGRLVRRPVALGRAAVRRRRDELKALAAAAAVTGRSADEVAAAAVRFAEQVHAGWLRPEVVDQLDRHRARGDLVVLVSASFGVYLRPLAQLLGADEVLATELEVGAGGRCTGALRGANCRGPVKAERLLALLAERGLERGNVRLWAYGDSSGDAELLAAADVAHWIGRSPLPRLELAA